MLSSPLLLQNDRDSRQTSIITNSSRSQEKVCLDSLPQELIIYILSFLKPYEQLSLNLINKKWCKSAKIGWHFQLKQKFSQQISIIQPILKKEEINDQKFYFSCFASKPLPSNMIKEENIVDLVSQIPIDQLYNRLQKLLPLLPNETIKNIYSLLSQEQVVQIVAGAFLLVENDRLGEYTPLTTMIEALKNIKELKGTLHCMSLLLQKIQLTYEELKDLKSTDKLLQVIQADSDLIDQDSYLLIQHFIQIVEKKESFNPYSILKKILDQAKKEETALSAYGEIKKLLQSLVEKLDLIIEENGYEKHKQTLATNIALNLNNIQKMFPFTLLVQYILYTNQMSNFEWVKNGIPSLPHLEKKEDRFLEEKLKELFTKDPIPDFINKYSQDSGYNVTVEIQCLLINLGSFYSKLVYYNLYKEIDLLSDWIKKRSSWQIEDSQNIILEKVFQVEKGILDYLLPYLEVEENSKEDQLNNRLCQAVGILISAYPPIG